MPKLQKDPSKSFALNSIKFANRKEYNERAKEDAQKTSEEGARKSGRLTITFIERVDKKWSGADFNLKQRFQKMIFPTGVTYDSATRALEPLK